MSDWKVIKKESQAGAEAVFTLGASLLLNKVFGTEASSVYTVENESTGEVRKVIAKDEDELGEKIANGDFCDDGD